MKRLSLVVWVCFFAVTVRAEEVYESTARIAISSASLSVDPITGEQKVYTYDPYYISYQLEVMESKPILEGVVGCLDLCKTWGSGEHKLSTDQAVQRLRKNVKIVPMRDASIVSIKARATEPELAAQIANTYAEVYRDSRIARIEQEQRTTIEEMVIQWEQQAEVVSDAEVALHDIRTNLQIASLGGEGLSVDEHKMQQMLSESLAAQEAMMEHESTLKVLKEMNDEDLIESASAVTDDPSVMNVIQQIANIDAEIDALSAELGEKHPERVRLEKQKEQVVLFLNQKLAGLRLRVQTQYDIAKERYNEIASKLEKVKNETIAMQGEEYRPYRKAVADLERARRVYDQLGARLRQYVIRSGEPVNPVEIFDRAEPASKPVSPLAIRSFDSSSERQDTSAIAYQLKKSTLAKDRLEAVLNSGDQEAIAAALEDLDAALNEALDAVE